MQTGIIEKRICIEVLLQHHVLGIERENISEKKDKMASSVKSDESMEGLHGIQEVHLPFKYIGLHVLAG